MPSQVLGSVEAIYRAISGSRSRKRSRLVSVNTNVREQARRRDPIDALKRQPEPVPVEHDKSKFDAGRLGVFPVRLGRQRPPALARLCLPEGDLEREQLAIERLGRAKTLDAQGKVRERTQAHESKPTARPRESSAQGRGVLS